MYQPEPDRRARVEFYVDQLEIDLMESAKSGYLPRDPIRAADVLRFVKLAGIIRRQRAQGLSEDLPGDGGLAVEI